MLLWDIFGKFPGTDYESFNYDWIIGKLKELKDSVAAALASEQAAADSATSASAAMGMALLYRNKAKDYRDEAQGFANNAQDSADSIAASAATIASNSARIDNLIATAGDGTIPSELTDMRVSFDGATYATAGAAVRDTDRMVYDSFVKNGLDFNYSKTFAAPAGVSHSSSADTMTFSVPAGYSAELLFEFPANPTTTGTAVVIYDDNTTAQWTFTAGTPRVVTFSKTAVKIGVYYDALTNADSVTMNVKQFGKYPAVSHQDSLRHGFVMGYLASPTNAINFDTNANTITVPIGVFYPDGNNTFVQINAQTLTYVTNVSAMALVVDFNNNQYALYSYADYRELNSRKYGVVAFFRTATPENCTTPYPVTINGLTPITTRYSQLPDYWINELDAVIEDTAARQTYTDGVTFGFLTDIHWETNNQVSPEIVNYMASNSRVKMWLNGGDTASGDGSDGTNQKAWMYECIGKFSKNSEFYSVIGNHDANTIGGGTTLSAATLKNIILPYDVTFGNGNYYYFDYRGTRFVCLDTGTVGANDPAQLAWATNVINNSTLPVIIVMHIVKVSYSDDNPCPFFTSLINAIGVNSNVKMIIAGHTHHDYSFIAGNGTPVVVLTTDSKFSDDGIIRTPGTLYEQCLNVVTIDYDAKTIHIERIGAVGNSMDITY